MTYEQLVRVEVMVKERDGGGGGELEKKAPFVCDITNWGCFLNYDSDTCLMVAL